VITALVLLVVGTGLGVVMGDAFADLLAPTERLSSGVLSELDAERIARDPLMAWLARGLLALALAWLLIGILSARTRLVRRPGAAAPRATWIAATTPWGARESTLGLLPFDKWLMFAIPAALLVATQLVKTSFLSWVQVVVVLAGWTVFALVVRVVVRRRSPWPVIAAVGGVVVLRCVVTLVALSFSGPVGFWFGPWIAPAPRVVYIALTFALFVWVFVAAGWAMSAQLGARRAWGAVLAAVGAGLAVPAAVVAIIGLEPLLVEWTDQVGILPWGLSRVLWITTSLGVADATAAILVGLGLVVAAVGTALVLTARRD
jgi:hypothetical protein